MGAPGGASQCQKTATPKGAACKLLPERHVRAAQAVCERPADAQQLGARGVPGMRVARVEHRLAREVLPADAPHLRRLLLNVACFTSMLTI